MIPILLHYDGAEIYTNNEYLCWSFCSLFASGDVLDVKFPLVVLPSHSVLQDAVHDRVHEVVAHVISWSLKIAASGIAPATGAFGEALNEHRSALAGTRLAKGWKGTFFGFRCDEKARKEIHKFSRSYQHGNICTRCVAQKKFSGWSPQLCYKNLHPSAAHRLGPISPSLSWLAKSFLGRCNSPYLLLVYGQLSRLILHKTWVSMVNNPINHMASMKIVWFHVVPEWLTTASYKCVRTTAGFRPVPCLPGFRSRWLHSSWSPVTLGSAGWISLTSSVPWSHACNLPGICQRSLCVINGILDEKQPWGQPAWAATHVFAWAESRIPRTQDPKMGYSNTFFGGKQMSLVFPFNCVTMQPYLSQYTWMITEDCDWRQEVYSYEHGPWSCKSIPCARVDVQGCICQGCSLVLCKESKSNGWSIPRRNLGLIRQCFLGSTWCIS